MLVGVVALGWPWPWTADGFDAHGRAIHWRWSPGALGAAITLWFVFFAVDGVWGLVEGGRKRFNPLSLLDEGLIAWMLVRVADAGVANGVSPALRAWTWATGGLALAAAVALELRRVTAPSPEPAPRTAEDVTELAGDLSALQAPGRRWSYWSVQRPPHPWLIGSLGPTFIIGGVAIPDVAVAVRVLLLAAGLLVLAVYSCGFCTVVTPRRLLVRAGRFGPALLRLATNEIVEVTVPQTVSLRDFLGWGIGLGFRGGFAGALAFNLGSTGVLVRTSKGSRYLIGADRPERLATALNAARGTA
jgi:hypothetical protein